MSGAIISGDAHFTVSSVAEQIIDQEADYLLAVKGNQPGLEAEMSNFFVQAHAASWDGVENSAYRTIEKGHGRIETREIRVVSDTDWLPQKSSWKNLKILIEIRSKREFTNGKQEEVETRFYISSRLSSAIDFAKWIRNHWALENNCHWLADVVFKEDASRADIGHSAENLAVFRRLAINMAVVIDPDRGFSSVRRAATFGNGYLKGLLAKIFLH